MTLKTLAAAATLAVFATTGVNAATFDFSFDASGADSGDMSLTAVGTLDINVDPGDDFTSVDISNLRILVDSDLFGSFLAIVPNVINGTISADGNSANFSDFFAGEADPVPRNFGCDREDCEFGLVFGVDENDIGIFADFGSPVRALASFQATAQVSAVPLPAGGLLLLSGLGGVAALKRRKKRAA